MVRDRSTMVFSKPSEYSLSLKFEDVNAAKMLAISHGTRESRKLWIPTRAIFQRTGIETNITIASSAHSPMPRNDQPPSLLDCIEKHSDPLPLNSLSSRHIFNRMLTIQMP